MHGCLKYEYRDQRGIELSPKNLIVIQNGDNIRENLYQYIAAKLKGIYLCLEDDISASFDYQLQNTFLDAITHLIIHMIHTYTDKFSIA